MTRLILCADLVHQMSEVSITVPGAGTGTWYHPHALARASAPVPRCACAEEAECTGIAHDTCARARTAAQRARTLHVDCLSMHAEPVLLSFCLVPGTLGGPARRTHHTSSACAQNAHVHLMRQQPVVACLMLHPDACNTHTVCALSLHTKEHIAGPSVVSMHANSGLFLHANSGLFVLLLL